MKSKLILLQHTLINITTEISKKVVEIFTKSFGSRLIKKEKEPKLKEPIENIINADDLIFPINIFPEPLQAYILECNSTLSSSIDYMGCSLLWVASICIGNSMKVEVKKGGKKVLLWFSLVGKSWYWQNS